MTLRVGINGFGRIGRQSMKAMLERYPRDIEVVAINDLTDTHTNAHLLKYDSTYGRFPGEVEATPEALIVNGHSIKVLAQRDPAQIPWGENFLLSVAERVLRETGLPGSTAWFLTRNAEKANALVADGKLDLVSYARPFLEEPHFPYRWARELKLENAAWATLPAPYAHWVSRYR